MLNQAQGVAATPYQAYSGQLVAPFNAEQNAGVVGTNQYANAAQPAINYATNQAAASSSPLTQSQIQQYESPYTQDVVNATQAQFNNQNAQQQEGIQGNAIAQGALGGNREAIAQAETANQENLAQAPVIAGLENQGYTTALSTAENQQATGLAGANAIGNLGVAGQTAGESGASNQLGAGTAQQTTQQALDTALLQAYQQQQAYPFQTAQWLAGIDTGVGSAEGSSTTGETTGPAPNPLNAILGGLSTGIGAAGTTGAIAAAPAALAALQRGGTVPYADGGQIKTPKTFRDHLMEWADEQGLPQSLIEGIAPKRAYGGGINGYATGGASSPYTGGIQGSPMGVSGMPWAMAPSYVPSFSGAHGTPQKTSGPSPATVPASTAASSLGSIANSIVKGVNGQNPLPAGSAVPGDIGPSSVGGPNGPTPLVGVAAPAPAPVTSGLDDLGGIYARGGGVKGYDDGGNVDDTTADQGPFRLDPDATQKWRDGIDSGGTTDNIDQPVSTPAQGILPPEIKKGKSHPDDDNAPTDTALAFSGDNGIAPADVRAKNEPQGIAGGTPTKSGFDWSSSNKLWPALMSAGFATMASRSPFWSTAVGEGGQAGITSYNQQHKDEIEAQQHAEVLAHQAKQEALAEQQAKQTAINQPVIFDKDGNTILNQNYIKAHEAITKDSKPIPITITPGDTLLGIPPKQGFFYPDTKEVTDVYGKKIKPPSEISNPDTLNPTATSTPQPQPTLNPVAPLAETKPSTFNNRFSPPAPQSTQPAQQSPQPAAAYQDRAAMPAGDPRARDLDYLGKISAINPPLAQEIKDTAEYKTDPNKLLSIRGTKDDPQGARFKFDQMVRRYDPTYSPTEYGLIYKSRAAYLPGTTNGNTISAFNTAISHLDTLKEMYKALNNGDVLTLNKLRNGFEREFGVAAPNDVAALSSIIGGEVVKATVGAQNALGDRDEVRASLASDLSKTQADSVIDKYQRLMAGQLNARKFAYEQATHLHNFDDQFLMPRSKQILKNVTDEGGLGSKPIPAAGEVIKGYKFKGGDPKDKNNWITVNG